MQFKSSGIYLTHYSVHNTLAERNTTALHNQEINIVTIHIHVCIYV